jgi:hypothetical protein
MQLAEVPDLVIIGRSDLSVISFRLAKKNIYDLCDVLKSVEGRSSWHLNLLQNPAACHIAITAANLSLAKEYFVQDVRDGLLILDTREPGSTETAAFYGATASAPLDLLEEIAEMYLDTCYMVDAKP